MNESIRTAAISPPSAVPVLRRPHDHRRDLRPLVSAQGPTAAHVIRRNTFAVTRRRGHPQLATSAAATALRPTANPAPVAANPDPIASSDDDPTRKHHHAVHQPRVAASHQPDSRTQRYIQPTSPKSNSP